MLYLNTMKAIKIILLNIILFFLIFAGSEFYFYKKWGGGVLFHADRYFACLLHTIPAEEYFDKLYKKEHVHNAFTESFRPDENINSPKKPVLFAGCSFTWGSGIEENQTVSHKTAVLTGRTVYNRGGIGWGMQNFIYQLRREDFYQMHKEPEYIIYIFIYDHLYRTEKYKVEPFFMDSQPRYKIKDDKLIEMKPNFFDFTASAASIQYNHSYKRKAPFWDIIRVYFSEADEEIKKHWKNTKFVILKYPMIWDKEYGAEYDAVWQELKDRGIIVIDAGKLAGVDLTEEKYKSDGLHPSAEAWDLILPGLISELKL